MNKVIKFKKMSLQECTTGLKQWHHPDVMKGLRVMFGVKEADEIVEIEIANNSIRAKINEKSVLASSEEA